MLLEYIDGENLCRCSREKLIPALDALIAMHRIWWGNSKHDMGYSYEKSLAGCQKRQRYLHDDRLCEAYNNRKALRLAEKLGY